MTVKKWWQSDEPILVYPPKRLILVIESMSYMDDQTFTDLSGHVYAVDEAGLKKLIEASN